MDFEECADSDEYSFSSTAGEEDPFRFAVAERDAGMRIDQFLVEQLPRFSRTQIGAALKNGRLLVDGLPVKKAGYRIRSGECVEGIVVKPEPLQAVPQPVSFKILFEDAYLIGLAKPPGLVVHPANGNPDGTLVNGLLYHCQGLADVGDSLRPGIVHRLDKDTSGVMVVAKTEEMHRSLVELFKARGVHKTYHALVLGLFREKTGRIVAPIGRHPVHRKKMAICDPGGRYAVTNWRVLEEFSAGFSLLEVSIETGRTHQIRVHMSSLGHPVAGDELYGKIDDRFARQMLHASSLSFVHPMTKVAMTFNAPLWPDMSSAVSLLRQGVSR